MNRRALFGFLGISPIATAGAALAAVDSRQRPRDDDFGISILPSLPKDSRPGGWMPGPDMNRKLELRVGEDGHLWMRRAASNRWERIVTA